MGGSGKSVRLPDDEDEHTLITQQPDSRREMRAAALRQAVEEGSLPADALLDDDDDESDAGHNGKDDERNSTQYSYALFHVIFFLATAWVATLLTMNFDKEETADSDFVAVGRTYWASWVKIISSWVCYGIYTWTLAAPVVLPDRFDFS